MPYRLPLALRRTLVQQFLLAVLLLASPALLAQSARANAPSVGLRLTAADAHTLPPNTLLFDYGSFLWAVLPADAAPPDADVVDYTLNLGEKPIDTRVRQVLPTDRAADFFLVQFFAPTQNGWLDDLTALGLTPLQYIYPFTYVVWGTTGQVAQAATLPYVHWVGRLEASARTQLAHDDTTGALRVVVYRSAERAVVEQRAGPLAWQPVGEHWLTAELAADEMQADELARLPGVYSVQSAPRGGGDRGELSAQIIAGNFSAGLPTPGYAAWLTSVGVNGQGVVAAVVDSGAQNSHPDLTQRFTLSCTGTTCGGSAGSSHGTHTAGILAGDGRSGARDSRGFLRGLGVAPGVDLIEQVYSPTYLMPNGMQTLIRESARNGAQLSSNSWGPSSTPRGYDIDTQQVDRGVRDADGSTPGLQPLLYVVSIMNGYGGYQTQGSPDEAKNSITVGATWAQATGGAPLTLYNDLSSNTAHGPALDGRLIPHLVAPGCSVDSTITGGDHGLLCGTSMAAPHVAGAAALLMAQWRNQQGSFPSPAMVKALLIGAAFSLRGQSDADGYTLGRPPDAKQGWGRLDLRAALTPDLPRLAFDQQTLFTQTGATQRYNIERADPTRPLRIVLVWTDAPGHGLGGSAPAWNNDLDLQVRTADGALYRGNQIGANGFSQTGGSADVRNNIEAAFLPAAGGAAGSAALQVTVLAANLTSDGVPGNSSPIDQDFALVCYNCRAVGPLTVYLPVVMRQAGAP